MGRTYIFTFDSLGSKHPAAIRNLATYLQMEAKDKKGLDFSQTTVATGAIALVGSSVMVYDSPLHIFGRFLLSRTFVTVVYTSFTLFRHF